MTTSSSPISLPSKSDYNIVVPPEQSDLLHTNLTNLSKIQKIIKNVEFHGKKTLQPVAEKLCKYCTSKRPDDFWTRVKYFISLPYKEGYVPRPQKSSENHMSPTEQALCQK